MITNTCPYTEEIDKEYDKTQSYDACLESQDKNALSMGFKYKIKTDGKVGCFYFCDLGSIEPIMQQMYSHNKLISVKNLEKEKQNGVQD